MGVACRKVVRDCDRKALRARRTYPKAPEMRRSIQ
jgi:hypothetical protein